MKKYVGQALIISKAVLRSRMLPDLNVNSLKKCLNSMKYLY